MVPTASSPMCACSCSAALSRVNEDAGNNASETPPGCGGGRNPMRIRTRTAVAAAVERFGTRSGLHGVRISPARLRRTGIPAQAEALALHGGCSRMVYALPLLPTKAELGIGSGSVRGGYSRGQLPRQSCLASVMAGVVRRWPAVGDRPPGSDGLRCVQAVRVGSAETVRITYRYLKIALSTNFVAARP
jgi:hypothetical protein